ncbi:MAG: GIY-YIG nuclease family protein [Candidatus Omnitrophica bacterium]|nr:GIY-YIG nuclease family protein [Candidatus Omnitrophota bacterium]
MWFVYILRCSDGSLYTGITTDLARRLKEHSGGRKGSKFSRSRRPVKIVYSEKVPDRSGALKREIEIKQLSKEKKEELLRGRR